MQHRFTRRQLALRAAALAAAAVLPDARADDTVRRPYLADMHSHYGMFLPRLFGHDLRRHMRDNGLVLLAWAIVDDRPWIAANGPLRQVSEPKPGEIWTYWQGLRARYEDQLQQAKLAKALAPSDVDAALAGEPRVLLACESANFLEGRPERLREAHAAGVRHVQLVHYIRSPLGDHQTAEPLHGGLTQLGARVVGECRRLGIVVDLAHGTAALVDAALASAEGPMVWSHSWITPQGGSPGDPGYVARSLALPTARRIAARGGVVGLWCLRENRDPAYPVKGKSGYADEILRMCELLGPQHVAFGTDMEGVWPSRMMNDYGDLRDVVDDLARRGVDESLLRGVFIENYARVVKNVMLAASAS